MRVSPLWIGLVLLIVAVLWHSKLTEAFQTYDSTLPYKTLNLSETKEVFLLGLAGEGYTKQEAQEKCAALGARLATRAEMELARDASGSWCKSAAWTADNDTTLLYPCMSDPTDTATCADGRAQGTPCLRGVPVPSSGRGLANCYGEKPQIGTTGVQYFNANAYSILDTLAVAITMSGDGTDMLPYSFTPAQALYGLRATQFQTSGTAVSGALSARKYLIDRVASLNANIRKATEPGTMSNEDLAAWAAAKTKSCEALKTIQDTMVGQLNALKSVMSKVQMRTMATYYAKQENMGFQREVALFCNGQTAATSPACAKLASIDFDTFYQPGPNGTKILADLENLNYILALRECEIQRAALKLQVLTDALKCSTSQYDSAALGQNYITALGTYYPDTCQRLDDDPTFKLFTKGADTRFTVAKNIGYVNSELLKVGFEEISPYFSNPGYSDLFSRILDQLSVLLRVPELNDYDTSETNVKTINTTVTGLKSFLTRLFSA